MTHQVYNWVMSLEYVTPEYKQQLDDLAETLMADRRAKLGQLSIYEQEQAALTEQVVRFEVGSGGEWSIENTVREAMAFNEARRNGSRAVTN